LDSDLDQLPQNQSDRFICNSFLLFINLELSSLGYQTLARSLRSIVHLSLEPLLHIHVFIHLRPDLLPPSPALVTVGNQSRHSSNHQLSVKVTLPRPTVRLPIVPNRLSALSYLTVPIDSAYLPHKLHFNLPLLSADEFGAHFQRRSFVSSRIITFPSSSSARIICEQAVNRRENSKITVAILSILTCSACVLTLKTCE
jgi:hypothetical protein